MKNEIRPKTVKLLARFLKPLTDEGVIGVDEEREILSQLNHLAKRGTIMPSIEPKLLDQRSVSEMLSISLASFKKQEREGLFPFKRKMVGSSVRYRNTDVIEYIMSCECKQESDCEDRQCV